MSGRALAERRGDIRRVMSSAVGGARSPFVALRSAPARLERHRLARSRRSPGNRVRCAASQRACRPSRRQATHAVVVRCRRASAAAARRARDPRHTDAGAAAAVRKSPRALASHRGFSECGGSGNLPRIIHIDPAEDGGAARGDAVAVLDRWRRRHAAGHRAPHTLNIAAPLGERSVGCEARQRRAPRLAETADSADSADARAAVRQRTAARAAGAAQIGDHGARAAGEDGALLHHADSCHRRVARLRDGRADRAEHLNHRHLAKILIDRAAGPVSSSRGGFGVLAV